MEIVYLTEPLMKKQDDWIEGHNDYIEFNPRDTWFYKHVINKEIICDKCQGLDYLENDTNQPGEFEKQLKQWKCYFCNETTPKLNEKGKQKKLHLLMKLKKLLKSLKI